jgi:hypothetical protein
MISLKINLFAIWYSWKVGVKQQLRTQLQTQIWHDARVGSNNIRLYKTFYNI